MTGIAPAAVLRATKPRTWNTSKQPVPTSTSPATRRLAVSGEQPVVQPLGRAHARPGMHVGIPPCQHRDRRPGRRTRTPTEPSRSARRRPSRPPADGKPHHDRTRLPNPPRHPGGHSPDIPGWASSRPEGWLSRCPPTVAHSARPARHGDATEQRHTDDAPSTGHPGADRLPDRSPTRLNPRLLPFSLLTRLSAYEPGKRIFRVTLPAFVGHSQERKRAVQFPLHGSTLCVCFRCVRFRSLPRLSFPWTIQVSPSGQERAENQSTRGMS